MGGKISGKCYHHKQESLWHTFLTLVHSPTSPPFKMILQAKQTSRVFFFFFCTHGNKTALASQQGVRVAHNGQSRGKRNVSNCKCPSTEARSLTRRLKITTVRGDYHREIFQILPLVGKLFAWPICARELPITQSPTSAIQNWKRSFVLSSKNNLNSHKRWVVKL